jgi:hypothetical protein
MATSNLITKSIGSSELQSGLGTPDHVSPIGSLYVDTSTGALYQSKSGTASQWEAFQTAGYAEATYVGNTTATTIASANTWVIVGNTFTQGTSLGFSVSTNSLVVGPGFNGFYRVEGNMTIVYQAGTTVDIEGGVSINDANPSGGEYNGATVTATTLTTQNITSSFEAFLNAGDTLKLAVRNLTSASNILIRHGQIHVYRIG